MGKHVHEHVELEVDSDQLSVDEDASKEEQLQALIEALQEEDIDIEVNTESEVIDE